MKKLLLPILLFCSSFLTAQVPANDEPGGATPVTVVPWGGTASVVNGTTVNATYTTSPPGPTTPSSCGCAGSVTGTPNDVWYVINTASFTNLEINVNSTSYLGAPGYLRIYQDTSGSGVPVQCYCSPSSTTPVGKVNAIGLSTNTTYYLAVSPKVGTNGFWGPFDINIFGNSFTLGENGFLGFNLKLSTANQNELNWLIAQDNEIKKFMIQRKSYHQTEFETIDEISKDFGKTNFLYTDDNFLKGGINLYRIISVTENNEWTYSNVQSANNGLPTDDITCYPNPGSDKLTVTREEVSAGGTINVFDVMGKKVHHIFLSNGTEQAEISSANWPIGLYYIQYTKTEGIPVNITWLKK